LHLAEFFRPSFAAVLAKEESMAFIQATTSTGAAINISAEHVVSVRSEGNGSVIGIAVATDSNGLFTYRVKEPADDIVGRVETALAYRRNG
jgi:hypothetical protein